MKRKRFLAIAAAIALSMTFTIPTTVSATEADAGMDIIDDEQEEGEQTTVAAPDAESESDSAGGSSSNTGSTGGNSGSSSAGSSTTAARSSDSSLAHLGIAPGSLSPAFSAGTYSYTATVAADVTRISVAARPNSSKAVIASVTGAKSIAPGTNTVKVVVEAENGATSTYTITVTCGSGTSGTNASSQTAQTPQPPAETEGETDAPAPEGEISTIEDVDDTAGEAEEPSEVKFDSNGYLIYEGNAYMSVDEMPAGDYVSLDKYNNLYKQVQSQKDHSMRLIIIFVVILLLLLIVILNLALKLRDLRQDIKLGIDDIDDEDKPVRKGKAKSAEAEPKADGKPNKKNLDNKTSDKKKPEKAPVAQSKKPEKVPVAQSKEPEWAPMGKVKKPDVELEILDLNDL